MSSDDDLGTCRHCFFHPNQESQLIDIRKGGFGLVEDVKSTAFQTMIEKRHKALAMRLRVQRLPTVAVDDAPPAGAATFDYFSLLWKSNTYRSVKIPEFKG